MYKSPIEVLTRDIYHQIKKQEDEQIYEAVLNVGVSVDKDELIRALQYDRGQYEKGYADAMDSIVRCKDCVYFTLQHGFDILGRCLNKQAYITNAGQLCPDENYFCPYGERRTADVR